MLTVWTTLIACTGGEFTYPGSRVPDYFPLDGTRSWRYSRDDVEWLLQVDKAAQVQEKGDKEIVTLVHSEFEGALLHEVQWSSDSSAGVQIHGYSVEGGDSTDFDPPVQFGAVNMNAGDTAETSTGGADYVSTFVIIETCPNNWVDDPPWECLRFELTGGSGSEPFLGTYWIAPRYGISLFQPPDVEDEENRWTLTRAEWEPEG